MSEPRASTDDPQEPGRYEIRLQGHLEARWAAWFDGLSLTHERDGTTVIRGPVVDQAALHGLLQKVRDLGLPLIAVMQVGLEQANGPDLDANTDHDHGCHDSAKPRSRRAGRTGGALVCELLGKHGQVDPDLLQARDLYELALAAYSGRDFDQAIGLFRRAAKARRNAVAAELLAARAAALSADPPSDEWDGTFRATLM